MPTKTIEALVDAGEVSAGPPLGPELGPLGVNIMEIIDAVNEKTKRFEGMKVPIKLVVDTESGEYDISIGTPPTSALIKEKLGIEKGSGTAHSNIVADMSIEEAMEVAEMKEDDLLGKSIKEKTKEIAGTCVSMGITVEGKDPREFQKLVDQGEYDKYF
ncbi:MAG: 50S ribosomal protein L11 [Candidatus Saliniplasma sp.]